MNKISVHWALIDIMESATLPEMDVLRTHVGYPRCALVIHHVTYHGMHF